MAQILREYTEKELLGIDNGDNYNDLITRDELAIIGRYDHQFRNDPANGYIAYNLADVSQEDADKVVNELNEINSVWYLGDAEEEYVFID